MEREIPGYRTGESRVKMGGVVEGWVGWEWGGGGGLGRKGLRGGGDIRIKKRQTWGDQCIHYADYQSKLMIYIYI